MNEISIPSIIFGLVLYTPGVIAVTSMFWVPIVSKWRIRWIELEHDTARAMGKEPRNIDKVFDRKVT